MITIPWHAWYGDKPLNLPFPASWTAQAYWPDDAPGIEDDAIEVLHEQFYLLKQGLELLVLALVLAVDLAYCQLAV